MAHTQDRVLCSLVGSGGDFFDFGYGAGIRPVVTVENHVVPVFFGSKIF